MNNPVPRVLSEGYEFKLGSYVSQGFDIFKRNAGSFIGYTVVFAIIMMVASYIPFATLLLQGPLLTGLFIVAYQVRKGHMPPFGEFFKGFNKFGPLLGISFFQGLIIMLFFIPFIAIVFSNIWDIVQNGGDIDPDDVMEIFSLIFSGPALIALLLAFIPAIYLGVSWVLSYQYAWFYDMGFWESMEASRKVVGKNWVSFFLFALVLGLINIGGVLLLGVGLLVTLPASYCAIHACFADINRMDDGQDDGRIADHLVN